MLPCSLPKAPRGFHQDWLQCDLSKVLGGRHRGENRHCENQLFSRACAPGVALGPPQDFTRIGCSVIFRKSWVVGTGAKTDIAKISCFFHACAPGVALGPPQDFTRVGCSVIFRKPWVVGTGAKTDIAKIVVFPCMCPWGRPSPPPGFHQDWLQCGFSKVLGGRHRCENRHCENRGFSMHVPLGSP